MTFVRFTLGLVLASMVAPGVPRLAADELHPQVRFGFERSQTADWSEKFTPEQFATALLAETNRIRAIHRLRPLKAHAALQAAADDHALTLALSGQCDHYSPLHGQKNAGERVRRHGVEVTGLAENVLSLAVKSRESAPTCESIAAQAVAQWMDSPGHRANLLNRSVTHFGGGLRFGAPLSGGQTAYAVQVFASF